MAGCPLKARLPAVKSVKDFDKVHLLPRYLRKTPPTRRLVGAVGPDGLTLMTDRLRKLTYGHQARAGRSSGQRSDEYLPSSSAQLAGDLGLGTYAAMVGTCLLYVLQYKRQQAQRTMPMLIIELEARTVVTSAKDAHQREVGTELVGGAGSPAKPVDNLQPACAYVVPLRRSDS
ncbi:hypothetical protein LX36DRAFT_672737 [Colletotrichum falcatum]|nr:hypothetical protein LX36DRAFT_672737 [Colletotrichum falcatum]